MKNKKLVVSRKIHGILWKITAVALAVMSIGAAIYLGVVVMLVGGIILLIDGINRNIDSDIAWGVVRIVFCEAPSLIAFAGITVAGLMLEA